VLLGLMPSIQELALLKTTRPYRLQGIGPSTGYAIADNLVPASGSLGITSMGAAAFAANQVFYASQYGIHTMQATDQFGDLRETFLTQRVEPYFRVNTPEYGPYDQISYQGYSGFADSPMLFYDNRNNLLFYGSRHNSTANAVDRLLVYDLNLKTWAFWNVNGGGPSGQITAFFGTESDTHFPQVGVNIWDDVVGGTSVMAGFQRDSRYDVAFTSGVLNTQTYIDAVIRHVSCLNEAETEKSPRYMFLHFGRDTRDVDVWSEQQSTVIGLALYADFATDPVFETAVDLAEAPIVGAHVVARVDLPSFRCSYLEVEIRNAQVGRPFTFFGYEVFYRARRVIRRAQPPVPSLLVNGSFETWPLVLSNGPLSWVLTGGTSTVTRSGTAKLGTYSASVTCTVPGTFLVQIPYSASTADLFLDKPAAWWQGQTYTLGAWVLAGIPAVLFANDSVSSVSGDVHSGSGDWEWLEITFTVDAASTVLFYGLALNVAGTALIDGAVLVPGAATIAPTHD